MRNEEYAILVNELQADPLGVGYANMTDDEDNSSNVNSSGRDSNSNNGQCSGYNSNRNGNKIPCGASRHRQTTNNVN